MSGATFPAFEVGTRLPDLEIPIDRTTIVATAIASQDFEDVHHDPGKAEGRGTPDIFMSINSTNGFIDRYITDWTGPSGHIRKVSLRLGVPNFPGDTMTMTGEVVDVQRAQTPGGADAAVISVVGRNSKGPHVTAQVVVAPYVGTHSREGAGK